MDNILVVDSMTMISFDSQLCTNCGTCVVTCPLGLILEGDKASERTPFMPDNLDAVCAKCGSCEAFCPEGAISSLFDTSYSKVSLKDFRDIGPEQLGIYMRKRRSVRNYSYELVSKEKIERIMDIVRYAPSGVNSQPVKWLIVHNPEKVRKITSLTIEWMQGLLESDDENPMKMMIPTLISAYENGKDPICRGAPHLAIAYTVNSQYIDSTDSVIALTWFELAAPAFGLGACWAGFVKIASISYQPLIDELNLPPGHVVRHAMMFGYPRYDVHSIPGRNPVDIKWK
ncbi:nitroreductase/ferredoxin [Methanolobus bombayensis]|nr:nitroreductase/ferredoxin [Methanolobus bombayensis]